jgi:hypothetical protein
MYDYDSPMSPAPSPDLDVLGQFSFPPPEEHKQDQRSMMGYPQQNYSTFSTLDGWAGETMKSIDNCPRVVGDYSYVPAIDMGDWSMQGYFGAVGYGDEDIGVA